MLSYYGPKLKRLLRIAGAVVIADQITKAIIVAKVPLHSAISVIPGLFDITHVLNPGGAFGFMANQSALVRQLLFVVLTLVAICAIFFFYLNTPDTHRWFSSALALIFGGAVGNFIDRLRFGKVVDFLSFYIGPYQWPAFNVADSAISIGLTIFIFHVVFNKVPVKS